MTAELAREVNLAVLMTPVNCRVQGKKLMAGRDRNLDGVLGLAEFESDFELQGCREDPASHFGCMEPDAINYQPAAIVDDGSCIIRGEKLSDQINLELTSERENSVLKISPQKETPLIFSFNLDFKEGEQLDHGSIFYTSAGDLDTLNPEESKLHVYNSIKGFCVDVRFDADKIESMCDLYRNIKSHQTASYHVDLVVHSDFLSVFVNGVETQKALFNQKLNLAAESGESYQDDLRVVVKSGAEMYRRSSNRHKNLRLSQFEISSVENVSELRRFTENARENLQRTL